MDYILYIIIAILLYMYYIIWLIYYNILYIVIAIIGTPPLVSQFLNQFERNGRNRATVGTIPISAFPTRVTMPQSIGDRRINRSTRRGAATTFTGLTLTRCYVTAFRSCDLFAHIGLSHPGGKMVNVHRMIYRRPTHDLWFVLVSSKR